MSGIGLASDIAGNGSPLPLLRARRIGVKTGEEAVVVVREDCSICRSEGFTALARIRLANGKNSVIATLYTTTGFLQPGEAGLSEAAWKALGVAEGDPLSASHPKPLASMSAVRSKIYGQKLGAVAMGEILGDIVRGRYSDVQLAAFITACSSQPMDDDEVIALTRAMVQVGELIHWDQYPIVDKHSAGGLPGNRTTPIVVAIAAASGLTMPKTSSRAITSPAGTADMMETLAPVDLDLASIRRVVEREGGCIAWGGAMRLSPADDILIRIERALDIDSPGQLVASILSKKIAAGASHLVIDMPVGVTAKIRSAEAANDLSRDLEVTANSFGLQIRILTTDGTQPVGRGIGPALEARDVLAVLQGNRDAPQDLRRRSLTLAAVLLEMGGVAATGRGGEFAERVLTSGAAWKKFQGICDAQGGMRVPPIAPMRQPFLAIKSGTVVAIDNRRLARIAKLAGAPEAKAAGVDLHVSVGETVEKGQLLYTVHAETRGELSYALDYVGDGDVPILLTSDA